MSIFACQLLANRFSMLFFADETECGAERMKSIYGELICIFFLVFAPGYAGAQQDSAGFVKTVAGDVYITSSQTTVKAVANMRLSQGDSIQTGPNGSVGLIFDDDTVVALGPNSEIAIENFLFNPAEKQLSFVTRLIRGTFSFISGQIAKLAPQKVVLQTPDATLGVRGTKFLVKVD
ncbi:hypothetical protein FCL47_15590 [Desulfopila sp. IMCC35006]|nr:hypothetical protein FCL47_15590 [Desulfopila sp. IMCC35006]